MRKPVPTTNASEGTRAFVYGNPQRDFLYFLVLSAITIGLEYMTYTWRGNRDWVMTILGLFGSLGFFCKWLYTRKHMREIILKPDGLEVYDKGTQTREVVRFKELKGVNVRTEKKTGSAECEVSLGLHYSGGFVSIEREELTNDADYLTIREWIMRGFERYQ